MKKERYIYLVETNQLYDNEKDNLFAWNINNDKIINLLNQQDARIKELENMNSRLSQGIYWGNGEHFCDVVKTRKPTTQTITKPKGD